MDKLGEGAGGVNGWGGCTHFVHGRSRMTIDPRMPTLPGRSTLGFHQPGRHCLHRAGSEHVGFSPTRQTLFPPNRVGALPVFTNSSIRLFPARRHSVALLLRRRIQPPAGAVPSTQTETAPQCSSWWRAPASAHEHPD